MSSHRRPDLKTTAYLTARARVLREETHCAICGRPVDKDAPPRTKWSPSVDHIVSPLDGGHSSDRRGLRLTHYSCNSRKGRGRTVIVPKVSRNL